MVNDHTRSAENWKCVWYLLRLYICIRVYVDSHSLGQLALASYNKVIQYSTKFWSEIRTMSGQNNTLPSCVEGVSGMGRIAEQWRLHFEHLFNCVHDPERYNMSFNTMMI